ncbi:Rad4 transglutaminase-like domain-domain-containing protein, partial [Microdochium bolleyi]
MVANLQPLGFGWSKFEEADDEQAQPDVATNGKSTKGPASKPSKKKPVRPTSRRVKKTEGDDTLAIDLNDSDEFVEPLSDASEDESIVDVTELFRPKPPKTKLYDKDLEFPLYWSEVLSPITQKYIPVDPIVKSLVGTSRELVESLEPRGGKADKAKQGMSYCIAHSQDGTAKDVTVRYLKGQLFPGKTKGMRMQREKIPVYNKHGKVKRYEYHDYFKAIMRGYVRGGAKHPVTEVDEAEESTDLKPAEPEKKEVKEGEETLQYYKSSKEYVLARHLKREEALLPGTVPVRKFRNKGKGGKLEAEEDVFLRKDIVPVKSAETWHKQGRAPMPGAEPLKHAPYRVATTNRRRELAEAEAAAGHKILQPLYGYDQTDWIIPDPIKDGVIPKNDYGNIDMFAEHMCPEGAVHIPYRGVVRVCKRMGIDFAEAVVGFEFGNRMAVPVIQGVVVAEEHHDTVIEELEKDEAERARKEDEKKRKLVLTTWRKLLLGLRVADRIREDYAHLEEDEGAGGGAHHDKDWHAQMQEAEDEMRFRDENMAGGFLPEGFNVEEPLKKAPPPPPNQPTKSNYFANSQGDDENEADPFEVDHGEIHDQEEGGGFVPFDNYGVNQNDGGGGFIPEDDEDMKDAQPKPENEALVASGKPATRSLKKAAPKAKAKPKQKQTSRRRSRRTKIEDTEDEDTEEED